MGKIPPRTIQKIPPRTIISGPVKTEEELVVISSPIEEKSLPGNRLLLTNIQGGDYGRIVGSDRSNIYRIETEYEIVVSTRGSVDGTYSLMISGYNEEMLYEVGKKYYVRINRTFASDGISDARGSTQDTRKNHLAAVRVSVQDTVPSTYGNYISTDKQNKRRLGEGIEMFKWLWMTILFRAVDQVTRSVASLIGGGQVADGTSSASISSISTSFQFYHLKLERSASG
ncbi:hypothetical protein DAPPUDRAFT_117090 [Daphnia pulex]|uniref:Uncharacterized protein n=1 Tax=Daphnia pulex TaxID=6669 RepID=E9HRI0_DAPPU|nr:hypothetical protein DAPPUDRAFT_117090 [Daphnia pulex]|eukprot:EFX65650.1 hypothetical protein DAPPUDRAFT_117090 [Daphnia pulex]